MEACAKRTEKKKLDSWGQDYRGPGFKSALKIVRARQANERGTWGTPEEERRRVENRLVDTLKGTDFKASDF